MGLWGICRHFASSPSAWLEGQGPTRRRGHGCRARAVCRIDGQSSGHFAHASRRLRGLSGTASFLPSATSISGQLVLDLATQDYCSTEKLGALTPAVEATQDDQSALCASKQYCELSRCWSPRLIASLILQGTRQVADRAIDSSSSDVQLQFAA